MEHRLTGFGVVELSRPIYWRILADDPISYTFQSVPSVTLMNPLVYHDILTNVRGSQHAFVGDKANEVLLKTNYLVFGGFEIIVEDPNIPEYAFPFNEVLRHR